MAATHEKREEYSSNVIRVLHPVQPLSSHQHICSIDNNLDYLLEDLQSSVSPGSYKSSSRDVQYLSPANSTKIIRERSISPGSEENRVFQTATVHYSSSTNESLNPQGNVDQLDTLLQDLKTERDITRERDYSHTSSSGIDPGLLEPASSISKSTQIYNMALKGNKPSVQRKLGFDALDDNLVQVSSQNGSPKYMKSVETKTIKDVTYEPGNSFDVQSSASEKNTIPFNTGVLPELKSVTLSDDILPVPGTKVTTTVRTYTYEIPGDVSSTNKTLLYKNESYNNNSLAYPERNIPPSVVFNTESYNNSDRTSGISPATYSPIQSSTKTVIHERDITDTNTNVYPSSETTYSKIRSPPPTIIYKNVTNKANISNSNLTPFEPTWKQHARNQTSPNLPTQAGPKTTYFYKHEASNTKNTVYGHPSEGEPYSPQESLIYSTQTNDNIPYPYPAEPNDSTIVTYKYSSHTSNSKGLPNEREPLMQPAPFPTDYVDHSKTSGSPPKRLDDLMANFNGNAAVPANETISRRKEVDTSVATSGEPKIPSKNIAGPPVYYPPGHEVLSSKEESAAAYRAHGGYARAAGRYEYEAESKSKSKSRSGAAVVPVCLPLCCAMPCSIM